MKEHHVHTLVLLRHRKSEWNRERIGSPVWTDLELAGRGCQQAREAGRTLRDRGVDVVRDNVVPVS